MERVEQRHGRDCLVAVVAMIAGCGYEAAVAAIGHDGSETPVRMIEVVRALACCGVGVGTYLMMDPSSGRIRNAHHADDPALVLVAGDNDTHAVLWDGHNVLDPGRGRTGTFDLDDYTLLQWWPVQRFE